MENKESFLKALKLFELAIEEQPLEKTTPEDDKENSIQKKENSARSNETKTKFGKSHEAVKVQKSNKSRCSLCKKIFDSAELLKNHFVYNHDVRRSRRLSILVS